MTTMKALVWRPERGLSFETNVEVPIPKNEKEELIRVRYCGVCGTDLHILEKAYGFDPMPIMGHEMVGEIVSSGQLVFANPCGECGACSGCWSGRTNFCRLTWIGDALGIGRDGGWSQFVSVPKQRLLPLPKDLPLEISALCEPLSCIVRGLDRLGRLQAHQNVLVLGAGIIGLLFLVSLHHTGCRRLTVVELSEKRRAIAKNIGFPLTVWSPEQLQASDIKFDSMVDCTGSVKVMEMNITKLERAGTYLVFGCAPVGHTANVDLYEIVLNEWKILGSRMNPNTNVQAIALLRDMYQAGLIDLERLGVKTLPLDQHETAFQLLRLQEVSKIIFEIPQ